MYMLCGRLSHSKFHLQRSCKSSSCNSLQCVINIPFSRPIFFLSLGCYFYILSSNRPSYSAHTAIAPFYSICLLSFLLLHILFLISALVRPYLFVKISFRLPSIFAPSPYSQPEFLLRVWRCVQRSCFIYFSLCFLMFLLHSAECSFLLFVFLV